ARAMVHLFDQKNPPFLGFFDLGDVNCHAADPNDTIGAIDVGSGGAYAPARLAIWTKHAKLGLVGVRLGAGCKRRLQPRPILRMNEGPKIVQRHLVAVRIDAEDAALPFIPYAFPADGVPVPRSHLAG